MDPAKLRELLKEKPHPDDLRVGQVRLFVPKHACSQQEGYCLFKITRIEYPQAWSAAKTKEKRLALAHNLGIFGIWFFRWNETVAGVIHVEPKKIKEKRDPEDNRKFLQVRVPGDPRRICPARNRERRWDPDLPFKSLRGCVPVAYRPPGQPPPAEGYFYFQTYDDICSSFADCGPLPGDEPGPASAAGGNADNPAAGTAPNAAGRLSQAGASKRAKPSATATRASKPPSLPKVLQGSLPEGDQEKGVVSGPFVLHRTAVGSVPLPAALKVAGGHRAAHPSFRQRSPEDVLVLQLCAGAGLSGLHVSLEDVQRLLEEAGGQNADRAETEASIAPDGGGGAGASGSGRGGGGRRVDVPRVGRVLEYWSYDISMPANTTLVGAQGEATLVSCTRVAELHMILHLLHALDDWLTALKPFEDVEAAEEAGDAEAAAGAGAGAGCAAAPGSSRRCAGRAAKAKAASGAAQAKAKAKPKPKSAEDMEWVVADISAVRLRHALPRDDKGQLKGDLEAPECVLEFLVEWEFDPERHRKAWPDYPKGRFEWLPVKDLSCPDLLRKFLHRLWEVESLLPRRGQRLVLVVGPPCQGITGLCASNNKQPVMEGDRRNIVILDVLKIVKLLKVQHLLVEQVPRAADMDEGIWLRTLYAELHAMEYQMRHALINAASYGAPQIRPRIFIWAAAPSPCALPPFPRPEFHPMLELPREEGSVEERKIQKLRTFKWCLQHHLPVAGTGTRLMPPQTIFDAISNLSPISSTSMSPCRYASEPRSALQRYLAEPPPEGAPSADVQFAQYLGNCAFPVLALPLALMRRFHFLRSEALRTVSNRLMERARRHRKRAAAVRAAAAAAAAAAAVGGTTDEDAAAQAGGPHGAKSAAAAATAAASAPGAPGATRVQAAGVNAAAGPSRRGPRKERCWAIVEALAAGRPLTQEMVREAADAEAQEGIGKDFAKLAYARKESETEAAGAQAPPHQPAPAPMPRKRGCPWLGELGVDMRTLHIGLGHELVLESFKALTSTLDEAPRMLALLRAELARLEGRGGPDGPAGAAPAVEGVAGAKRSELTGSGKGALASTATVAAAEQSALTGSGNKGSAATAGATAANASTTTEFDDADPASTEGGTRRGSSSAVPAGVAADADDTPGAAGGSATGAARASGAGSGACLSWPVRVANHIPYIRRLEDWARMKLTPGELWGDDDYVPVSPARRDDGEEYEQPQPKRPRLRGERPGGSSTAGGGGDRPFGRFPGSGAAGTVCGPGRSTDPNKGTVLHPQQARLMTNREYACMQGVRLSHAFLTTVSPFMTRLRDHSGPISRSEAVLKPAIRGLEWLLWVGPRILAGRGENSGEAAEENPEEEEQEEPSAKSARATACGAHPAAKAATCGPCGSAGGVAAEPSRDRATAGTSGGGNGSSRNSGKGPERLARAAWPFVPKLREALAMLRRVVREENQQIGNGWSPPVARQMGRCLALALTGWRSDEPYARVRDSRWSAAWAQACAEGVYACHQARQRGSNDLWVAGEEEEQAWDEIEDSGGDGDVWAAWATTTTGTVESEESGNEDGDGEDEEEEEEEEGFDDGRGEDVGRGGGDSGVADSEEVV